MNNGEVEKRTENLSAQPIGQLLLSDGLIIPHDLEFALEHQKYSDERLGQILVRMGAVSQQDLENALSRQGISTLAESEALPPIFVFS